MNAIRILLVGLSFFPLVSLKAAEPKFSITPLTRSTFLVANDETIPVQYRIVNNTNVTRTLTMNPIPGITQITIGTNICANPFVLSPGQSCILSLSVFGGAIASSINQGPQICKTLTNTNTPDPFLCSQPSRLNSLSIQRVDATKPFLFANTFLLTLTPDGLSKNLTITNGSPTVTALNVKADLSGTALGLNVTQDASGCEKIPPGQSCNLIFTPNSKTISLTEFPIAGTNTRTVGAAIVVAEPENSALIRVTGTPLILQPNQTASVTIQNNSLLLSATNIQAHDLPLGITQDASNCTDNPIPPGGSCELQFTATSYGVPAFISLIYGSDTSLTQATLGVDAPPLLNIAFVGDSSLTLQADGTSTGSMTIQNTSGELLEAGVTAHFEGTALSGNVSASTCGAMNNGDTCTIIFTAGRTSVQTDTQFPIYKENATIGLIGTIRINPSAVAYLSNARSNDVYQCAIEGGTNNLNQCQTFSDLGLNAPRGVAVNPDKTRTYIVNNGNNSVTHCEIESNTHYLVNCQNANANGLNSPVGIAINPTGTNAYITNTSNNTVSRCPILPDGGFANGCVDSGATALGRPQDIAFKADNSFAYIANYPTNSSGGHITQCAVDNNSLTSCSIAYQGSSGQWSGLAISPGNNKLYTSDFNYSEFLTCVLVDGGGLSNCIGKGLYSTTYRSGGVAVNSFGTVSYVMNSEASYSAQILLNGSGEVQSFSKIYTTPAYLWGIALLEFLG